MQTSEDIIREQQRAVWNQFAPGWKKWDDFTMRFLQPMGDAIIKAINLKDTDAVLDVATGTGEPGLTIASIVTKGSVIGTDLSENMLTIAQEKAKQLGLTNYQTQLADVSKLPFADSSFDAVSCRMGFMFFPDMAQSAQELVRVLKPGGRLATSVWAGPEQNAWISLLMGIINRALQVPPPPAGAPGMFRCAKPGLIAGFLEAAGLSGVTESVLSDQVIYKDADEYWANMNEVAAPVVSALKQVDQTTIARIKEEVWTSLREQYGNGELALPFSTLIIQGSK
ncbi:methyltransferase domain-containing protein [Spirosoma sp. HMF4905]|uniref:Methyltransferase domain-containing protein n=1 Tax=Spirosoma arboris TaxID=2682092 RepID=A0A7K1S869_9BACT|nr:methyltransferase domain-containing protein [Spirosoma arboris]MVM29979.1 methyltransferase domain-containing protein [Spirosoma arboris]